MIRECTAKDFENIYSIINEAAKAYKDVIPMDRWKEPYMSHAELQREMNERVRFFGYEENSALLGIMGIQDVDDVSLIRHAYVKTKFQNQGIGKQLLNYLCN